MNFNDYPEDLKKEEQAILDHLISDMDKVIDRLDQNAKKFVEEAKNASISRNPDEYTSFLLAKKRLKDTEENRKKMFQGRDELYKYRLLLRFQDEIETGTMSLKVGLHDCGDRDEQFVISWKRPLCRNFVLNNSSTEFDCKVPNSKSGKEYHTHYNLLVKNEVKLRFTRIISAMNLFPGAMNDKELKSLKNEDFFSNKFLNKMINHFDPDKYNPDEAAKIISDEFLQELLERRATPEFKNIVFSIQKKQGEIIQAPYNRNMVVQGCAGSGKSMIMLHRLPILLYDNPTSLSKSNLYIITPSQMYIQLAENMRYQLEISDIKMGTIEQYYDYCIEKYSGYKTQDYGKIDHSIHIGSKEEKYIFSSECISDIKNYFEKLYESSTISLEKAYSVLSIKENGQRTEDTYAQKIRSRLLNLQSAISKNEAVLSEYYKKIQSTAAAIDDFSTILRHYKNYLLHEIEKRIKHSESEIKRAEKGIENLDPTKNAIAVQNRRAIIGEENRRITSLSGEKEIIENDESYFEALLQISNELRPTLKSFEIVKKEYSQNTTENIYQLIDKIEELTEAYDMLSLKLSKVEDRYILYLGSIKKTIINAAQKIEQSIFALKATTDQYLELDYYKAIRQETNELTRLNESAVSKAYEFILKKIICLDDDKNENVNAIKYSPYLYLQILYQFKGKPASGKKESLLAIDEAQGLAPEELRLLKNVNGDKIVMNLYGDIFQHIEGTKGIDAWDEFKPIIDFDMYEMQENYRNASQITNYCNRKLGMNMQAINTAGKGVHEMNDSVEFQTEFVKQLIDSKRVGLGAILIADDREARYLMDAFSKYKQKFHDMTGEEFGIHRTRWNIMNINDAKGLEFSSVIVLSGRMSKNQKYVAYTRALDDLYIYPIPVELGQYDECDQNNNQAMESSNLPLPKSTKLESKSKKKTTNKATKSSESSVRTFFEKKEMEIIDKRAEGGRLWVIGEKEKIRSVVNEAIEKFNISGKYMICKESNNKNGWCTKTEK